MKQEILAEAEPLARECVAEQAGLVEVLEPHGARAASGPKGWLVLYRAILKIARDHRLGISWAGGR